jgi:outer membrane receptor protein involved in Fe transport
VYYVGVRQATLPNTFTIPAYTRVDAALFWKFTPKVELAVNIQNIGDARAIMTARTIRSFPARHVACWGRCG